MYFAEFILSIFHLQVSKSVEFELQSKLDTMEDRIKRTDELRASDLEDSLMKLEEERHRLFNIMTSFALLGLR